MLAVSDDARWLRVLLIEDAATAEEPVRVRLGGGFRLRRAPSLRDGCSLLAHHRFDVVLLDARVRESTAAESMIRLKEACRDVPIVVWNVAGDDAGRLEVVEEGASGFARRGKTDAKLARSLQSAIDRHREYRQSRVLFDTNPDGVIVLDPDDRVVLANGAALELLGKSETDLVGQSLATAAGSANGGEFRLDVGSGRTAEAHVAEIEWDGRKCRLLSLRDVTERLLAHQRIANLVNELLTTNQKLVHQASQDPLTSVLNRRGLQDVLIDELARMHRASSTLSAMLIDCDDFKGINDTLGYAMGDAALVIVANTLKATLRPQDRVGRVGGDEFLVLLPGTRPTEATLVGQRLLQELSVAALPPALRERKLTVSIGVDRVPIEASTIQEVISAAATPLKAAKSHGKQRISTAGNPAIRGVAFDESNDISELLSDPSRLRVASQSIVRMEDGAVIAQELFVRGPRGELEQPSVLFALASSSNSLITFDLNCLRASMTARAKLGRPLGRCHVNLHPQTLIGVPLQTILDVVGLPLLPHELCIEISEQQLVGSPMRLRDARIALRSRGIDVALDDVGFGHSSLEALIVLEPDIVKIDRRFVHGVSKDIGRSRDLKRLAGVLQGLGAQVIAEGVESRADIDALIPIGIAFGQGYFWDKPTVLTAPPPPSSARAI